MSAESPLEAVVLTPSSLYGLTALENFERALVFRPPMTSAIAAAVP